MPAAAFFFDWQNCVAIGIGLVALAYLVRRWWPAWRGLWQRPGSAAGTPCERAAMPGAQAPTAACGGGCGSCGSAASPQRDHRITVQRSTPR